MFSIPRVNVIQSDEGFSVEVELTRLTYTEGPKTLHIASEIQASPGNIVIYKGTIRKWEPPYDSEPISDHKREVIIENIRRAFRFKEEWIDVL